MITGKSKKPVMTRYYADNPSGPSNPTRQHLYVDCPTIYGIASPTGSGTPEVNKFILQLPVCGLCLKRSKRA